MKQIFADFNAFIPTLFEGVDGGGEQTIWVKSHHQV
jgi:hypothetical protein